MNLHWVEGFQKPGSQSNPVLLTHQEYEDLLGYLRDSEARRGPTDNPLYKWSQDFTAWWFLMAQFPNLYPGCYVKIKPGSDYPACLKRNLSLVKTTKNSR